MAASDAVVVGPSPRGLLVIIILVGEPPCHTAIATLLLLLLLLRLHPIVIHARGATNGVAITTHTVTVSHVVWARHTVPPQVGVGLVVVAIATTRGVIVLVMVAVGAVPTASTSLLVSATPSSALVVVTHVATTTSTDASGSTARTTTHLVLIMRLVRGGAIPTTAHTLPGHQALVSIAKLMSSLGRSKRLLAVARMAVLHAIGGMAHLGELAGVHVRRVGVLHGGHPRGHAAS
mmetsp:Transcript_59437/g.126360  ORF Transcript_59437/g.126360 Transcript_59437/m.126360 type:complete len:234 (-) Transcript_59437:2367-3068(-)